MFNGDLTSHLISQGQHNRVHFMNLSLTQVVVLVQSRDLFSKCDLRSLNVFNMIK